MYHAQVLVPLSWAIGLGGVGYGMLATIALWLAMWLRRRSLYQKGDPPIVCAPGSGVRPQQVRDSHLFRHWLQRCNGRILVHAVLVFAVRFWDDPGSIKTLHLYAEATDYEGKPLDSDIFTLSGDRAEVMVLLTCQGRQWLVVVARPRVAAGKAWVISNPVGVTSSGQDVLGWAQDLIDEELMSQGLPTVGWPSPANWLRLETAALGTKEPVLTNPDLFDERVRYYRIWVELSPDEAEVLTRRFGQLQQGVSGPQIAVIPYGTLLDHWVATGSVPLTTLCSVLLNDRHQGLQPARQ